MPGFDAYNRTTASNGPTAAYARGTRPRTAAGTGRIATSSTSTATGRTRTHKATAYGFATFAVRTSSPGMRQQFINALRLLELRVRADEHGQLIPADYAGAAEPRQEITAAKSPLSNRAERRAEFIRRKRLKTGRNVPKPNPFAQITWYVVRGRFDRLDALYHLDCIDQSRTEFATYAIPGFNHDVAPGRVELTPEQRIEDSEHGPRPRPAKWHLDELRATCAPVARIRRYLTGETTD